MGKRGDRSSSTSALGKLTAPRIERKIIEKNRRNRMKGLCSNLISLLPHHTSNSKELEGLPLPYQIDEAVEYIQSMKMRVEEMRQKKESLLARKRCDTCKNQTTSKSTPLVEVHDMGPNLHVIIANGLDDYSTFRDIIGVLHQHGVEVASANFSRDGHSAVQVLNEKVI